MNSGQDKSVNDKYNLNRGKENLKNGILSPIVFFMTSMITVVAIGSISLKLGENILVQFLTPACIEIIIIFYMLFKRSHYTKEQARNLLRLKNFKKRNIAIALGVAITFLIFSSIEQGILNNLTHNHTMGSNTSKVIEGSTGITQIILLGLLTPFIAPLIEEIFFRGLTMGMLENSNLRGRAQQIIPILTNSLFFALMHCQGFSTVNDINVMVIVFTLAIINSILVHKTNSIYTSIMVHMFYNGTIALLALAVALN